MTGFQGLLVRPGTNLETWCNIDRRLPRVGRERDGLLAVHAVDVELEIDGLRARIADPSLLDGHGR